MDQYQFGAFTGYAAAMDADAAEALKTMAGVTGVEPNRKVRLHTSYARHVRIACAAALLVFDIADPTQVYASQSCTSQKEAVWGLVLPTVDVPIVASGSAGWNHLHQPVSL
jgi:hypothetical protein